MMQDEAVSCTEDEDEECRALWITWERQLRNRSLADRLGVPLREIQLPIARYQRYLRGFVRTVRAVRASQAKLVIAQNPSIVLCWILLLLRSLFRYRLAIDAHYGGVVAYNGNRAFQWSIDYCNSRADLVIVTNEGHANHVQNVGGKSFVCEDPFPDLKRYGSRQQSIDGKHIFVISSFDVDEPREAFLKAAQVLSADGFTVYVSGNYEKSGIKPDDYPDVQLLGFTPEHEYYSHLLRADIVLDLTTNQDCLVCGAYEAVSAGVPLVLSDTRAQRAYFGAGAVFTTNEPEAIADAVRDAYKRRSELEEDLVQWRAKADADMNRKIHELRKMLGIGNGCLGKAPY